MKLKKSSSLKLLSQSQLGHLKKFPFFGNGGHLGYKKALTDTILKGNHLRIISAKFG
jgi:hypothetical protein